MHNVRGLIERCMICLEPYWTSEEKHLWPKHLPELVFVYNCTEHASTGFSPFYLMFGREPWLPVDSLLSRRKIGVTDNWVTLHQERLKQAYRLAKLKLDNALAKSKRIYDKN